MKDEKEGVSDSQNEKPAMNEKAEKFSAFLTENNINVFENEVLNDNFGTTVFRSRVEANGQILPMAIIIDNSVFTIIRTQIISNISIAQQEKIVYFLNMLNEKYKIFKYYLRADGIVFLDIVLPFTQESFDSQMIHLMLSLLVQHLGETYGEIMGQLWSKKE